MSGDEVIKYEASAEGGERDPYTVRVMVAIGGVDEERVPEEVIKEGGARFLESIVLELRRSGR